MKTYTLIINGELVSIVNLLDYDNNKVNDWDEAFKFVAGPFADGSWFAALC